MANKTFKIITIQGMYISFTFENHGDSYYFYRVSRRVFYVIAKNGTCPARPWTLTKVTKKKHGKYMEGATDKRELICEAHLLRHLLCPLWLRLKACED